MQANLSLHQCFLASRSSLTGLRSQSRVSIFHPLFVALFLLLLSPLLFGSLAYGAALQVIYSNDIRGEIEACG